MVLAKAPIWHDRGVAYDISELCRCFAWCCTGDEVEVEDAAISVVLQVLALVIAIENDSLSITIEMVDGVRTISTAMIVVCFECAIEITLGQE